MADATLASPTAFIDPEAAAARRRYIAARIFIYGVLTIFALIYIIPLLVVISNSFRDLPEIAHNGLISFPHSFSWDAWGQAWSSYCVGGGCNDIKQNFINSVELTLPATLISTVIGALNGYVLSKWKFRGSEVIFTSGSQQPITAALVALGTGGVNVRVYNVSSAAVLIGAIPPLLVYFFGGKYFVRGLTQGAIK